MTTKSKVFGGLNLGDIARGVKERGEASPFERGGTVTKPVVPAADLALSGRSIPAIERETVHSVDPRRCRPWKFHNRTDAWYTRERCADLIESLPKDGQLEPALARKLVGDPNYDYELIFGMRRRYAAEVTGSKLKVRLTDVDDAKAAVLMHVENADRQDITPMERALSFAQQLEAGVFGSQEALATAVGLGAPTIAKMLKATQVFRHGAIQAVLVDRAATPIAPAYELATVMEKPGARDVVLQAAQNLAKRKDGPITKGPAAVLTHLLTSLDRSRSFTPLRRQYNVGAKGQVVVSRNPKGKVTLAFPKGLGAGDGEALKTVLDQILRDLG